MRRKGKLTHYDFTSTDDSDQLRSFEFLASLKKVSCKKVKVHHDIDININLERVKKALEEQTKQIARTTWGNILLNLCIERS